MTISDSLHKGMTKILITGSKGQLGKSIEKVKEEFPSYQLLLTDIEELDITDQKALTDFLQDHQPEYIVNCAAYTAVDKAEVETEAANKLNIDAVSLLVQLSSRFHIPLVHVSTDYVFDGKNFRPYKEDDPANPVSAYGKSKYLGEKSIVQYSEKTAIIRTSWLYSEFGHNFVKTMIKYGRERDSLNVVYDQVGTPTYATDLARTIMKILPEIRKQSTKTEIYHYGNEGAVSWYDFALAIMEISGISCNVIPIETNEYPLPAPRPHYSVLNKKRIKDTFQIEIPYWKDSLTECLRILLK